MAKVSEISQADRNKKETSQADRNKKETFQADRNKKQTSQADRNNNQKRLNHMSIVKYLAWRCNTGLLNVNPTSPLKKAYRNSYYCNWYMHWCALDERLHQKALCKNRWCQRCSQLRSYHYRRAYGQQLEAMKEKYFITLTAPTVPSEGLKQRIKDFEGQWRKIMDLLRKYTKKGTHVKFSGLRKMECTLRPNDHYHYHYHILIDGKEVADFILLQWLKRFSDAIPMAQDIRTADNQSVFELFKYFTKMSVPTTYLLGNMSEDECDLSSKSRLSRFSFEKKKSGVNVGYYAAYFRRLDFLFCTLHRKRVFQPFGGLRKLREVDLSAPLQRPEGHQSNFYYWNALTYQWEGRRSRDEKLANIEVERAARDWLKNASKKHYLLGKPKSKK